MQKQMIRAYMFLFLGWIILYWSMEVGMWLKQ